MFNNTSMKELKDRISGGENVWSNDLCNAILNDGVENVRFLVPFQTSNYHKKKTVLCKIQESERRKVESNYKITLVPVEYDKEIVSFMDFYTDDFLSLIKTEKVKIMNSVINK